MQKTSSGGCKQQVRADLSARSSCATTGTYNDLENFLFTKLKKEYIICVKKDA